MSSILLTRQPEARLQQWRLEGPLATTILSRATALHAVALPGVPPSIGDRELGCVYALNIRWFAATPYTDELVVYLLYAGDAARRAGEPPWGLFLPQGSPSRAEVTQMCLRVSGVMGVRGIECVRVPVSRGYERHRAVRGILDVAASAPGRTLRLEEPWSEGPPVTLEEAMAPLLHHPAVRCGPVVDVSVSPCTYVDREARVDTRWPPIPHRTRGTRHCLRIRSDSAALARELRALVRTHAPGIQAAMGASVRVEVHDLAASTTRGHEFEVYVLVPGEYVAGASLRGPLPAPLPEVLSGIADGMGSVPFVGYDPAAETADNTVRPTGVTATAAEAMRSFASSASTMAALRGSRLREALVSLQPSRAPIVDTSRDEAFQQLCEGIANTPVYWTSEADRHFAAVRITEEALTDVIRREHANELVDALGAFLRERAADPATVRLALDWAPMNRTYILTLEVPGIGRGGPSMLQLVAQPQRREAGTAPSYARFSSMLVDAVTPEWAGAESHVRPPRGTGEEIEVRAYIPASTFQGYVEALPHAAPSYAISRLREALSEGCFTVRDVVLLPAPEGLVTMRITGRVDAALRRPLTDGVLRGPLREVLWQLRTGQLGGIEALEKGTIEEQGEPPGLARVITKRRGKCNESHDYDQIRAGQVYNRAPVGRGRAERSRSKVQPGDKYQAARVFRRPARDG